MTEKLLTIDDALYGLRNLSVMDEEETRVEDIVDQVEPFTLQQAVRNILAMPPVEGDRHGRYAQAYRLVIESILRPLSRETVVHEATRWVKDWNEQMNGVVEGSSCERDNEDDLTVAELMSEYDDIFGTKPTEVDHEAGKGTD